MLPEFDHLKILFILSILHDCSCLQVPSQDQISWNHTVLPIMFVILQIIFLFAIKFQQKDNFPTFILNPCSLIYLYVFRLPSVTGHTTRDSVQSVWVIDSGHTEEWSTMANHDTHCPGRRGKHQGFHWNMIEFRYFSIIVCNVWSFVVK